MNQNIEPRRTRGILYGLPVIVTDDSVTPANWFAGVVLNVMCTVLGYNGWIVEYDEGEYWSALWLWLKGDHEE